MYNGLSKFIVSNQKEESISIQRVDVQNLRPTCWACWAPRQGLEDLYIHLLWHVYLQTVKARIYNVYCQDKRMHGLILSQELQTVKISLGKCSLINALGQNFFISWFTNPPTVIFRKVETKIISIFFYIFYPPTLNIICKVEKNSIFFKFCLCIFEIYNDLIQTVGLPY